MDKMLGFSERLSLQGGHSVRRQLTQVKTLAFKVSSRGIYCRVRKGLMFLNC